MTYRTRDTNFAKNYCCGRLEIRDKELISNLNKYWIDEDKTLNVKIPDEFLLSPAIWRGILDGDGCFGFRTKNNTPFIGLVTKSENLKNDFLYVVKEIIDFDMKASRNKRDNAYNLGLTSLRAKEFITWLLSEDDNYIERKHDMMIKISQWEPKGKQGKVSRRWTPEEDEYVFSHTIEESLLALNRTRCAIKCRKTKINKEKKG